MKELIIQMQNDGNFPTGMKKVGEIVRCADCKWWGYEDDDGISRVCHAAKHGYMTTHWDISIYRRYRSDFYCADGERKTDEDR